LNILIRVRSDLPILPSGLPLDSIRRVVPAVQISSTYPYSHHLPLTCRLTEGPPKPKGNIQNPEIFPPEGMKWRMENAMFNLRG
jgi:hypothetical protein